MIPGYSLGQKIVVDTNVISYIFKGHGLGPSYARLIGGYEGIVSFQTLGELSEWSLKNRWGARRTQALLNFVAPFNIVYGDPPLCAQWAAVRVGASHAGKRIDPADAWIAATALALGCPLVTHNAADFAGVRSLTVISAPNML